jgi:hypothetical protein
MPDISINWPEIWFNLTHLLMAWILALPAGRRHPSARVTA